MTTRPLSVARRRIGLIVLVLLTFSLVQDASSAQSGGGREWVNIFSANSTLLGQPVPVGAVVTVHDPQGTECGSFEVGTAGAYGYLACYRDDPTEPGDDGAEPGDPLSFRINGLPAQAVPVAFEGTPVPPSTPVTWTSNGDLWEVDLHAPAEERIVGGYSVPRGGLPRSSLWGALLAVIGAGVALVALAALTSARRRDTAAP